MEVKDYRVNADIGSLEDFANAIKVAVCNRIALTERFSAMRLRDVPMNFQMFGHGRYLGLTKGDSSSFGIFADKHGESVLNIAETVIHELGHVLIGAGNGHNENWHEACRTLGLVRTNPTFIADATPTTFDPPMFTVISEAIAQWLRDHPQMITNVREEIPWPSDVGLWTCPLPHESYHPCYDLSGAMVHFAHILQFQDEGIREMLRQTRAGKHTLLADEMGLGKTVQVMGYINATNPERIFIGCPNNAKLVWFRHFQKFCVRKYPVEIAYTQLFMFGKVVIMNYEAMRKWGDAVKRMPWDLVVDDEAQYLKTPSAARSKAAYAIKGAKQIMVTGTPIVNYPYEIFPLIHYLDRDNWPEYGRFEAEHGSRSSEKLGRNLNRLNEKLRATIMVRREKRNVMKELPRKRRSVIEFVVPEEIRPLIESEKKLYESMKIGATADQVTFLNAMRNESDVAATDLDWAAIIESLKATRGFAFEEMARIAHNIALAKLPLVVEHIEQVLENREKVVVFGHHRDVLSQIHKHFAGNAVLLLGGHVDQAEITQLAVDRFNSDPECKVFVAGITLAAGYSISGSSTVLFVEQSWVPGDHMQAEDRAHGIGRGDREARSMLIQHLTFEDSLDTYKAQLSVKKQKSIERATGSQATT